MKHFRSFAVVIAFCCVLAETSDAQILMKRTEKHSPLFLPSTALFKSTGEFASIVPEKWRARHAATERLMRTAGRTSGAIMAHGMDLNGCNGTYLAEANVGSAAPRDTRGTTIANAKAIFFGTIVSATPGLFDGSAGSLLQLGAIRTLKTSPAFANVRDALYVRHPSASFNAGGVAYCRQTAPGAIVPAVGDQVLVFAFRDPSDQTGLFVYTFADDLIVQSGDGRLEIPKLLEFFNADGDRLETIVTAISHSVGETPRPPVLR